MSGRAIVGANFEDDIDAMMVREIGAALGQPVDRHGPNPNTPRRSSDNDESGEKYDLSKDGYVLVLHHYEYSGSTPNRAGSDIDMKKIENFFLGYRTEPSGGLEVHDNLTLRQVRRLMDSVSRKDFSSNSCLIVIIMSHGGKDDTIVAYDEKSYSFTKDVWRQVAANPTLVSKPKVFIVNACRGSAEIQTDSVTETFDNSDAVIFQSTFEGHVSYRNPCSGSFFVQTFFELLQEHDNRNICDLNNMLNSSAVQREKMQNPTMRTTLGKRLVFGDLRREPGRESGH